MMLGDIIDVRRAFYAVDIFFITKYLLMYSTTYCTIIRTVDLSSTCTRHYRFKDVNAQKIGRGL